jgi:hypothetical protein
MPVSAERLRLCDPTTRSAEAAGVSGHFFTPKFVSWATGVEVTTASLGRRSVPTRPAKEGTPFEDSYVQEHIADMRNVKMILERHLGQTAASQRGCLDGLSWI